MCSRFKRFTIFRRRSTFFLLLQRKRMRKKAVKISWWDFKKLLELKWASNGQSQNNNAMALFYAVGACKRVRRLKLDTRNLLFDSHAHTSWDKVLAFNFYNSLLDGFFAVLLCLWSQFLLLKTTRWSHFFRLFIQSFFFSFGQALRNFLSFCCCLHSMARKIPYDFYSLVAILLFYW